MLPTLWEGEKAELARHQKTFLTLQGSLNHLYRKTTWSQRPHPVKLALRITCIRRVKTTCLWRPPAYEDHHFVVPRGIFHVTESVHIDHLFTDLLLSNSRPIEKWRSHFRQESYFFCMCYQWAMNKVSWTRLSTRFHPLYGSLFIYIPVITYTDWVNGAWNDCQSVNREIRFHSNDH